MHGNLDCVSGFFTKKKPLYPSIFIHKEDLVIPVSTHWFCNTGESLNTKLLKHMMMNKLTPLCTLTKCIIEILDKISTLFQ